MRLKATAIKSCFFVIGLWVLVGCTSPRLKRYHDLIDPHVGKAKKEKMDSLLGVPSSCKRTPSLKLCEYRTASERNEPVPGVLEKPKGFGGPDVSPYEYFDVLHLFYDDFGVLQEWNPVVIQQ